jgi:hypothetical protein
MDTSFRCHTIVEKVYIFRKQIIKTVHVQYHDLWHININFRKHSWNKEAKDISAVELIMLFKNQIVALLVHVVDDGGSTIL